MVTHSIPNANSYFLINLLVMFNKPYSVLKSYLNTILNLMHKA